MIVIPEWQAIDWVRHGFGTRQSETWTHGSGRTWLKQTHSSDVIRAESSGCLGEGDALATNLPGLTLEIRTADCIPILLIDPIHHAVAAIHAGWRGTKAEIARQTVEQMRNWYGSEPEQLLAAIGPGIGPCCFEVGPEVAAEFGRVGRVKLNLAEINRDLLKAAGVRNIVNTELCTRCDGERFHSYRRDREAAGRMEAGIEILA